MPPQRKLRPILPALAVFAAMAFGAPGAFAADAHYEGISADGAVAVFSAVDKLVPGDTDIQRDIYVRDFEEGFGYVTREASLGPTGGNDAFAAQFLAIDPSGEQIFFSTRERLAANDKDSATDIYVRDLQLNTTTLVSAGSASCAGSGCGNGDVDVGAVAEGVVDEGNDVFFVTSEQLSTQDSDESPDVYVRDIEAGTTTLVSAAGSPCSGSCGNGAKPAFFQGASADGSKAIFTTGESLVNGDGDSEVDLYERNLTSGETKLVSTPGAGPEACPLGKKCEPVSSAISSNGAHVFFETNERIAAEDSDAFQDVYDWSVGTAGLASTGPLSGSGANALYEGSSADGSEVFFATDEKLVASDEDAAQDVYVRNNGIGTELVSEGDASCAGSNCGNGANPASLEWVSASGATAVLTTAEPLVAADGDARADVYLRQLPGGPTALASRPGPTCTDPGCGNGSHDAFFQGASADASHLFFVTSEALAPPAAGDLSGPGDRDEQTDVYERDAATAEVSVGQQTGSGPYTGNGPFNAFFQGASADGAKVFLITPEQLTAEDSDSAEDVYMRSGGGTLLVSRSNDAELEAELAPPGPELLETDPESPGAATSIHVLGEEPVEGAIKLYSSANCTGEPVGTGTAAELNGAGIAVTVGVGSATTFHAIAEAEGFVSPCSGEVFYRQRDEEGEDEGGFGGIGSPPSKTVAPRAPGPLVPIPYAIPHTRITFGPAAKTRIRRPIFRFTDTTEQSGTHFSCKVDHGAWKSCSSPIKLKKLRRGRHAFLVKGTNGAGEVEPQPSKRKFKVVE